MLVKLVGTIREGRVEKREHVGEHWKGFGGGVGKRVAGGEGRKGF
jgi:hypothetical protein